MSYISLMNGFEIPNLCFGTGIIDRFRSSNPSLKNKITYYTKNAITNRKQWQADMRFDVLIKTAMNNGCCMFDTSKAYGGAEFRLGRVLRTYKRDDFFIITKLSNNDQFRGDIRGALEKSLKELRLDYVDIYLMHWPVTDLYLENWKKMEKLYQDGLCRAIGVCNCNIHHLKEIEQQCSILPMINEIECHPLFTQSELRDYCKEKKIQVLAYTSTGRMDERLYKTVLVPVSNKYGKSIPQVILKWHQQMGNIPIFNSTNPSHLRQNCAINDFQLTEKEMGAISNININSRLRYDPDNCDFSKL